jgi:hypothetical protein
MRLARFSRSSLALCAVIAALGGCGGRNSILPQSSSGAADEARSGTSTLEVLHAFRDPRRGMNPIAPVVADASGNLYGETFDFAKPDPNGGCGTVFKLMPSRGSYVETTLHRFQNKPDGCSPDGGLAMDSSGALYGTTDWGGRTPGLGAGTVFKLTPVGSGYRYRVVYRFKDHRDGAWPTGGVILDKNGTLYGTTQYGASYACAGNTEGCGTVYSLTPNGSTYTEKILHVFKGGKDGLLPLGAPAMDSSGSLYGTTWLGGGFGSIGVGTVYKLSPSGSGYTEQVIHAFGGKHDGSTPWAPVIIESTGAVIGTTQYGGLSGGGSQYAYGTVFRLTPSRSTYKETIIYYFRGGSDGFQPQAPVTEDGRTLYGTTSDGAGQFPCHGQCGTVFALSLSEHRYVHSVLYHLNVGSGWFPQAGVILDNGALFGTTEYQGRRIKHGGGTVFKLTP